MNVCANGWLADFNRNRPNRRCYVWNENVIRRSAGNLRRNDHRPAHKTIGIAGKHGYIVMGTRIRPRGPVCVSDITIMPPPAAPPIANMASIHHHHLIRWLPYDYNTDKRSRHEFMKRNECSVGYPYYWRYLNWASVFRRGCANLHGPRARLTASDHYV